MKHTMLWRLQLILVYVCLNQSKLKTTKVSDFSHFDNDGVVRTSVCSNTFSTFSRPSQTEDATGPRPTRLWRGGCIHTAISFLNNVETLPRRNTKHIEIKTWFPWIWCVRIHDLQQLCQILMQFVTQSLSTNLENISCPQLGLNKHLSIGDFFVILFID